MFSSVLIANRGEVAVRIARACKDLGVTAIAVYSEADRDADHVRLADQAYRLGPADPAQSYLSADAILDVARKAGVDAIHPGYGFLAEDAAFADETTAAGFVFVGPGAEAIRVMGDKLSARAAAIEGGAAVVPGTDDAVADADEIVAFGQQYGFPVAIKASFGGGGRGMKVVAGPGDAVEALAAARRESVQSFGRDECYVERYLRRPRHVEMQVLADTDGTVIHLGDRDCSLQRRYQKLVEEAPAHGLPPVVRSRLVDAAVAVTRQVGYVNAGTCEFLVETGDDGSVAEAAIPYFLEMNTRLQVEHPVTELVTGVDLVAAQLRIAAGDGIGFTQDDVAIRGHAIEVRINAEDPGTGFLPSPGTVTAMRIPSGPWVRWDASLDGHGTIPADYDSMIAKLTVWGHDRSEAIGRMRRALSELSIAGVPTTASFHRLAMGHPTFIAATHSTHSVEHDWDLTSLTGVDDDTTLARPSLDRADPAGDTSAVVLEIEGRRYEVVIHQTAADTANRQPRRRQRESASSTTIGGASALNAPMQGTVVAVAVDDGDKVNEGDVVVVLEAMKMENPVRAHRAGTVHIKDLAVGQVIRSGAVIATIE
ncbi:MAG: biotin carboxylase N-terminal domain-containing protein [Nitriliruptoraceae bacterium]